MMELGEDIVACSPYGMMQRIGQVLATDTNADEHDRLTRKAQNTRIRRGESIEDYLSRHKAIRAQMIRAKYPGIDTERATVMFEVRGL